MGATVKVDADALLGTLAAFRTFDKDQKKETAAALKRTALPLFRKAYTQRRRNTQAVKAAGIGSITLTSTGTGTMRGYSTSSRVLSGGLNAAGGDWPWIEFGSKKAHGRRGQLPYWQKSGRIFYPAVDATIRTAQRAYIAATYDTLRAAGFED